MNRLYWLAFAALGVGLILLIVNDSSGSTFGLSNDGFATTLYLGVWGAVLATGILGSGMRFGEVARSLAAWMLIVLALVAGYQYRYELQDIASRVSAGLVPGSPLSAVDADGAMVMLDKSANGHFEVRGLVDGMPVRFLVDTGASATVLSQADAVAAGFDPAGLSYTIPVSTANGVGRAARVTAGELAIGYIVRRNLPMLVAEPGMLGQSLLGMNFIGSLSGFDMRGDRMILRD